ncbi:MAG: hypothetical protein DSY80_02160, partial [Desulfocapsa sp.]
IVVIAASKNDLVILELSSFQLQDLSLSPHVAVITNLFSDHMDHHKDEGLYSAADPRIIETIGSTTSLVAGEFNRLNDEINRSLAVLIAGTILLDTVNLDDEAGRVTDADKEIAAQVLPLCPVSQQEFFDNVQKEKFNVVGLSTNDLLRKDYKEWQFATMKCGIGSALLPVSDWSEMDKDLAAGFAAFSKKQNLDLLLSMNAYTDPDFHRDLVLFCKSKDAHDALFAYLQDNILFLETESGCSRIFSTMPGIYNYLANTQAKLLCQGQFHGRHLAAKFICSRIACRLCTYFSFFMVVKDN